MALIVIATSGAADANSYLTVAEANDYFASRVLLPTEWDDADSKEALLIMATRTFEAILSPRRELRLTNGVSYYYTSPTWTGTPATTVQRLMWPRSGMYDRNGNLIASNVIPQELKDAVAEFAGQLGIGDRTLDNDVIVQGIKAIRAGSVGIDFKNDIVAQVLPDAIYNLLVQSWITDELIEPAVRALFDVVS